MTALARAEWIGFVAAFYNKEGEAAKQFTAIKDAYTSLSRPVTDSSMKVLWVSYYADITGFGLTDSAGKAIGGALYIVSFAPYKVDLSESAGLSILPAKEEWMAAEMSVMGVRTEILIVNSELYLKLNQKCALQACTLTCHVDCATIDYATITWLSCVYGY